MDIDKIIKQLKKSRDSLEKTVENHSAVLEVYEQRLGTVIKQIYHLETYGKLPDCEGCKKS